MATARCVFAAEVKTEVERPCGMHGHACTEIVCYLEGSGRLVQKKQQLRYGPGSASIYQPGMEHADVPESSGTQVCVGVSGCGAEKLPSGMLKADESVMKCAGHILQEIKKPKGRNNQERLDILAGWLVLELHRIAGAVSEKNSPHDHAIALKKMIDTRFDEIINLQELAGTLYISPDYLRHIFKQRIGESPLNYLIRKRLDSARELLNFSDLPVSEIAHRVGLDNAYYFSRLFHKRIGFSPSEYRRHSRKKTRT
jgi:AraC-like DNA-binding protein